MLFWLLPYPSAPATIVCPPCCPKVSVQKLHVHEQAKKRAKVNPVEELIQAAPHATHPL